MKTFVITMMAICSTLSVQTAVAKAASTDNVVRDFKMSLSELPNRLLKAGYSRIGDIDATTYLQDFNRHVSVTAVDLISHPGGTQSVDFLRDSAQWHRTYKGDTVAVNRKLWKRTEPAAKPVLALHESLGALGYDDHLYTCSEAIWLLTNEKTRKVMQPSEISKVEQLAENSCKFAGGSTGVSGGGDEYGVSVKLLSMTEGLDKLGKMGDQGERDSAIDDMFGTLAGSDFFVARPGVGVPLSTGPMRSLPYLFTRFVPNVSTITVVIDGKNVPQDKKNGWTFDPSINGIRFHGKYDTADFSTRLIGGQP